MFGRLALALLATIIPAMAWTGTVRTITGETYTGNITFQTNDSLAIVDSTGKRITLARSSVSLMTSSGTIEPGVRPYAAASARTEPDTRTSGQHAYAGYAPVYVAMEKNPGEAALYSLIGIPGVVPLGQLYNGEMRKAGNVLIWRVASLVVGIVANRVLDADARNLNPITEEARDFFEIAFVVGGVSYLASSVYCVADAAISADRINRRVQDSRPAVKVGLTTGF